MSIRATPWLFLSTAASVAVVTGFFVLDLERTSFEAVAARQSPLFTGKRGVSVVQTFMFPSEDRLRPGSYSRDPYVPHWPTAMPPGRINELKRAGFDFLRVAVDPGPLLDADTETRARLIGEISAAAENSMSQGLNVVVDIHPTTDHPRWNFNKLTAGLNAPAVGQLIEIEEALARSLARFDADQCCA